MPAASTTLRTLAVSVIALLTVTGCQALDDAGRAMGRADVVNDLAARIDRALELTYSAQYQLSGGRTASINQSQDPARSAYEWPEGKLTVTAEATTRCEADEGRTVCTLEAPPAPNSKPPVVVFAAAEREGLVTPPLVMGLLTSAALDPGAVITQRENTIAGHHATCVDVRQTAESFNACVTAEGVLGSFTGQVDGVPVELALSRYQEQVDGAAFELPPGAGVVDHRPAI
ncbi:hypothetical protein [Micromonospora craniellae]|uniref:Uncharacterized protein n=1 Tax=Micromonospora craniellae TaxID=2294034 RepID=A0A372FR57_9ACTN|nr:hypothetical protein [Micromonospora craniellae]QOC93635.1 hypothetical protein ID554_08375 [Micromonospora craniellae]RFS43267.1 hypothetical protein D0Q02_28820 [Micromonospora craniellae]